MVPPCLLCIASKDIRNCPTFTYRYNHVSSSKARTWLCRGALSSPPQALPQCGGPFPRSKWCRHEYVTVGTRLSLAGEFWGNFLAPKNKNKKVSSFLCLRMVFNLDIIPKTAAATGEPWGKWAENQASGERTEWGTRKPEPASPTAPGLSSSGPCALIC